MENISTHTTHQDAGDGGNYISDCSASYELSWDIWHTNKISELRLHFQKRSLVRREIGHFNIKAYS